MEHGFINRNSISDFIIVYYIYSSSRRDSVCHKSSYYGRKLSIKFDLRNSEVTNIFYEKW